MKAYIRQLCFYCSTDAWHFPYFSFRKWFLNFTWFLISSKHLSIDKSLTPLSLGRTFKNEKNSFSINFPLISHISPNISNRKQRLSNVKFAERKRDYQKYWHKRIFKTYQWIKIANYCLHYKQFVFINLLNILTNVINVQCWVTIFFRNLFLKFCILAAKISSSKIFEIVQLQNITPKVFFTCIFGKSTIQS